MSLPADILRRIIFFALPDEIDVTIERKQSWLPYRVRHYLIWEPDWVGELGEVSDVFYKLAGPIIMERVAIVSAEMIWPHFPTMGLANYANARRYVQIKVIGEDGDESESDESGDEDQVNGDEEGDEGKSGDNGDDG